MAENEKQVQPESAQAEEVQEEKSVLDQILEDGRMTRDESQREWAKDVIGEFVS
jgi:type VI secretion system protein ImpC